jgi:hypothetical protein
MNGGTCFNGQGLFTDGSTQYADISSENGWDSGTGAFSLEIKFKWSGTTDGGSYVLFDAMQTSTDSRVKFGVKGGRLWLFVDSEISSGVDQQFGTVTAGTLHHVVVTQSATGLWKVVLDGVQHRANEATWKWWGSIGGSSLSNINWDSTPSATYVRTSGLFSGDPNWNDKDSDGGRMTGWYLAKQTGVHYFATQGDDENVIYMDPTPGSKTNLVQKARAICCTWTNWQSGTNLVAGEYYWFDVRVKEGGGGDYQQVGIYLPDGSYSWPISIQNNFYGDEITAQGASSAVMENIRIGGSLAAADEYFHGDIQFIRMWEGDALSDENIYTLYESMSLPKILTATFKPGLPYEVAEIVVIDSYLPDSVTSLIEQHYGEHYELLFDRTLPLPTATLHAGFMIEGGDVEWGTAPEITWGQSSQYTVDLDDTSRAFYGLDDQAHSMSGDAEHYLVSDYLQPACIAQTSATDEVDLWGFDPVSTTAISHSGREIAKGSYGVEIESLTICRRMQTTTSALRSLPDSTVCGLLSYADENPTCQPTKLQAEWSSSGIYFRWLPGCRAATAYQLVRDRDEQVGADFEKKTDSPYDAVTDAVTRKFCTEEWIEPGVILADINTELLKQVGREVEYCIRSLVPLDEGGVVVSDWMCTTVKIGWKGVAVASVTVASAGSREPGILVDGFLCQIPNPEADELIAIDSTVSGFDGTVSDESCATPHDHTGLVHALPDGGSILAFSAYSTSSALVDYSNTVNGEISTSVAYAGLLTGSCKYASATSVSNDKPDFVVLVEGSMGLAWFSESPGCFLHIENYEEKAEGVANFDVIATGGVQRVSGYLGFAHHFKLIREPSWHYMASHCRETCQLTGRTTDVQGETFSSPFVADVRAPEFCMRWAHRCPAVDLMGSLSAKLEGRGAMLFGSDTEVDTGIICSPYLSEFAYFDAEENDYKCCEGQLPTSWDQCNRRFTECTDSTPFTSSHSVPLMKFMINVDTAHPYLAEDALIGADLSDAWLDFEFGTESLINPVVSLVDKWAADSYSEAIGDVSDNLVKVANAQVGNAETYVSGRTEADGTIELPVTDSDGPGTNVKRLRLFPFAASEFLSTAEEDGIDAVNTTKHNFAMSESSRDSQADGMVASITHQGRSAIDILDVTAIMLPVYVTHPQVGDGLSCGAEGHRMCAFSTDGKDTMYSCETTDANGLAYVSVPPGVSVKVRNGCPAERESWIQDCSRVENLVIGRTVEKYDQEVFDSPADRQFMVIEPADCLKGTAAHFVEQNSRFVDIHYAAGRYLPDEVDDDDKWSTAFMLSADIQMATDFNLTHTGKAGCNGMTELPTLFSLNGARTFKLPIPRDLDYTLEVNVTPPEELPFQNDIQAKAATYINSLPAISVPHEVSDGVENTDPVAEFMLRVPATVDVHVMIKDASGVLPSCFNENGFKINGVSNQEQVEVVVAVHEFYNSSQGEGAVSGDAVLTTLYGSVEIEDNMAASSKSRRYYTSTDDAVGSVCELSAGCILDMEQGFTDDTACGTEDVPCDVGGEDVVGTYYTMLIDALSQPERYTPHLKLLRATFTPSYPDVPSELQREMLKTDVVSVNVVVEGEVSLTKNQAIKLPEYIPFLILRDPPGAGSSSTWESGTTMSLSLDVGYTDESGTFHGVEGYLGGHAESKANFGAGAGIGAFVFGGADAPIFEIDAQAGGGYEHENSVARTINHGNSVSFAASTSFSTSEEITGAYADLFITPALAIRTITVLPIVFNDDDVDPTQCMGLAQNEKSTWELLDGKQGETVDGVLLEYGTDAAVMKNDDNAALLGTNSAAAHSHFAKLALQDDTWNALTVHNLFDILHSRIPQLQARCFEEWNSLKCNFDSADWIEDTLKVSYPSVVSWCGLTDVETPNCIYIADVEDTADCNSDCQTLFSKHKITATLDGITGWMRAVQLNEDLKIAAAPVRAGELIASPLLPNFMQGFNTGQQADMVSAGAGFDDALRSAGSPDVTGDVGSGLKMATDIFDSSSSVTADLTGFGGDMNGAATTNADASIIAFSGGGGETTYSYSSTKSTSLSISFATDSSMTAYGFGNVDIAVFGFRGGLNAGGGSFGGGDKPTIDTESGKEVESENTVDFTLSDPDIGDYFDVQISHDPIYGTPVFDTLAGRSLCPHEIGTDAREAFDVVFPILSNTDGFATSNELDMVGTDVNKKFRSVHRGNGASAGSGASFYVEVVNETPYGDNLELLMELTPPNDDVASLGQNDFTGLRFEVEGEHASTGAGIALPLLMDDQRRMFRIDVTPTGGDDRNFLARQARFDTLGTLDAQGNAMDGYTYCNLAIKVWSACEYDYFLASMVKGSVKVDDSQTMCSEFDAEGSKTFPNSASCYVDVLPEIFDGTAAGGHKFSYEEPLTRKVLIPCLSFHPTENTCERNPCSNHVETWS